MGERATVHFCAEAHKGGCEGDVQEWAIEGYDPVPVFVLCEQHASDFGFCTYCGAFIGGTEDVFLVGRTGLCFDCFMRLEHDMQSSIDDDYEWEDYP